MSAATSTLPATRSAGPPPHLLSLKHPTSPHPQSFVQASPGRAATQAHAPPQNSSCETGCENVMAWREAKAGDG
ncbi:hypothetical protein CVT26_005908 [Gymnopilus dilepis]|uniref:Uncharacterized protein n=1 Tax=Gymnopilus dilepis TaxID=231916 RepID=A0A409Y1P3_9AGAR|nr:hypothetical protein CVT26_005908 [Gymnopilus dilepis]